jgi:energy-coupling factor transporter ATP-binding protein EcfA2
LGKENCFTWIKAIPTFNGLRQIIFEPSDRVSIQQTEPDYKEPHNIISSIKITDETGNFGNQEIIFNKNLNTIIGGKSSGKSLLLYFLANNIDPEQMKRLKEKFDEFEGYLLKGVDFHIEWADGIIDTFDDVFWDMEDGKTRHKITYIPQLYINHLAEKKGKDQLNQLIHDILLQNKDYKYFKDNLDINIRDINNKIESSLESLLSLRNDWYETTEERKKYASQDIYEKQIIQLNEQHSQINTISILSESELKEYTSLIENKNEYEINISKLSNNKNYLSQIRNEIVQSAYNLIGDSSKNIVGNLNKHFAKLYSGETNVNRIVEIITEGFKNILSNFDNEYSASMKDSEISIIKAKLNETKEKLKPYDYHHAKKTELTDVLTKKEKAKADKNYSKELDNRIVSYSKDYSSIKSNIAEMLKERTNIYSSLEDYINKTFNDMGFKISLNCNFYYPLDLFKIYDSLNKQFTCTSKYLVDFFDTNNNSLNYKKIPDFFQNLYRIEGNLIYFSDNSTHQLKTPMALDTIFNYIIQDNFKLNYDVTYKGDNLIKMSPGKKGTVLLILFLELSTSDNPILIDQPEDNLDNQTVYDLLGKMIKEKKKKRQIIIVTHNANLVVNTDAENVIVANQEGQDHSTPIGKNRTKFEYINGPIELSFREQSSESILSIMGIKQHICDILEGGDEAFKLREQKYKDTLDKV